MSDLSTSSFCRCGHCKSLAPEWDAAAGAFEPEDDVIIAAVDATKSPDLVKKYGVKGYPTIKYFPKGKDDVVLFTIHDQALHSHTKLQPTLTITNLITSKGAKKQKNILEVVQQIPS